MTLTPLLFRFVGEGVVNIFWAGPLAAALCVSLLSCSGGEPHDKNYREYIDRESLCVAASERLNLYSEAQRHFKHAEDAANRNAERLGGDSDLQPQLQWAREEVRLMPARLAAYKLVSSCDAHVTQGDVDSARLPSDPK